MLETIFACAGLDVTKMRNSIEFPLYFVNRLINPQLCLDICLSVFNSITCESKFRTQSPENTSNLLNIAPIFINK